MAHTKEIVEAGLSLSKAKKALIMLHGRGATAQDILSLRSYLSLEDFYVVAPQATNYTWYPYSFLSPLQQNEPWLSSALKLIGEIVTDVNNAGIKSEDVFFLGFSQGACLTLEFATRNAQKWGGIVALTGGLIGDKIYNDHYSGNFHATRILMTNSPNDPHVPLTRSEESKKVTEQLGASVVLEVYANRPHTILPDELEKARAILS
ncbi:phospholipase/carboxylesterase [Cytophagales bacterium WSM2-2]|nr:phospholipase/carboxylesterase [Cytophagales bacterium WSM2-2]